MIFAPLPAFAGGRRHGPDATTIMIGVGGGVVLGTVGVRILDSIFGQSVIVAQPAPVVPQPSTVILPPAYYTPRPRVIWPANCAPQYGIEYGYDPYNPAAGRSVPTGLIECRWPNGQTTLYYPDGRPVVP
jgi:hypothetical protein